MQSGRFSRAVGWGLEIAQNFYIEFPNIYVFCVFPFEGAEFQELRKWNLCLLAGKGVEMAKKLLRLSF